ncbi:mediator of RNA polymerase II [Trichuris trichiura]|uniref:glucose-6-phosphatase n=1 Tax=Trichuris trichiura TaxID=36087 RepID=A0A077Z2U9_TRITR|nr:mediator of RNA polymerase II [Trichuris trichiura]
MDYLRRFGIQFILWLQQLPIFGEREQKIWLVVTKLGDPALNFSLYFPLFYPFLPVAMTEFAAVGAISEFMNCIFKWMLLDERPYWWFYTSGIHEQFQTPLKQFKWTCETGPGSPSGHAMVSSSVWLVFLRYVQERHLPRNLRPLVWFIYVFYLIALCLSRTFIGAHFPDQVALGSLFGILLSISIGKWTRQRHSFISWLVVLLALTLLSLATYVLIGLTGRDPDWSIALAKQYCQRIDWVHISTTPLASYFRDVGVICAIATLDHVNTNRQCLTVPQRILSSIVGISAVSAIQWIPIGQLPSTNCYYISLAVIHFFIILLVGIGLPNVICRIGERKKD